MRASWEGSDPDLITFFKAFSKDLQARGMPFFAHCFVRSHALQDTLYANGVSKARAGQSPHNWGMAVDVVHYGRFWQLTRQEWAVVGLLGKEAARRRNIKVTWGGDWRFYDPAHWELSDWKDRASGRLTEAQPFSQAFARARAAGLSVFTWNGSKYTTDLA